MPCGGGNGGIPLGPGMGNGGAPRPPGGANGLSDILDRKVTRPDAYVGDPEALRREERRACLGTAVEHL
jgi:hypothetical protein